MVKEAEENEELRYSLRSLKNIKHDQVWLVGFKPSWVKNVNHIERFQRLQTKYRNLILNAYAACKNSEISDDFIYMDDDFFFLQPVEKIPLYHNGHLNDLLERYKQLNGRNYIKGLEDVINRLGVKGHKNPLSYELHIPMIFNKEKLSKLFEMDDNYFLNAEIFHMRSFYGNYYNLGGSHANDVKIKWQEDNRASKVQFRKFISTTDDIFSGYILSHLRDLFPTKGQYE